MDPLPLSISIVCFNNEATIGRVLASIRGLARQVVALDSGSTDGTIEMLRAEGVTVVDQPWLGYVKQKQAALERCDQPWILHLDSDESLEPELRAAIEKTLRADDASLAGCTVNRKVWYAGAPLNHAWQPERRLRLVRKGAARWGGYDPHDDLELIPGAAGRATRIDHLPGDLRHDSILSISDFLARQARHAQTAAAALAARGRKGSVARLVFSPLGEFAKQIVVRSAWRDGWRGWVAAGASSAAVVMKHAALIEATRAGAKP